MNYDEEKTQKAMSRVQEVIDALLSPEKGCPWDKDQTPLSLTEYVVEECFELVDAIRSEKPAHACDEMGDLLFLLIFTARRYAEENIFDFADALNAAADKMIRRHPHVFADAKFETKEEFVNSWAEIKKQEKLNSEQKTGVFSTLVKDIPPLTKAYRIHSKAAQAGFTWEDDEDVEKQVEAEWLAILDASLADDKPMLEHELGNIVFSLTELGRRKGIKIGQATDLATQRFIKRFESMEKLAQTRNLDFNSLTLDELDTLWNDSRENN